MSLFSYFFDKKRNETKKSDADKETVKSDADKIAFEKIAMEKRGCAWCKDCVPRVNWWCINKDAIKARKTAIPNVIKCPYFTFDASKIEWE